MISKFLRVSLLLVFTCATVFAQTKIELQTGDTIKSILEKQVGQNVELRMKSGDKIAGKLEKLNDNLAHLSSLTGAEYFDGVVVLENVAAVVVRAKAK